MQIGLVAVLALAGCGMMGGRQASREGEAPRTAARTQELVPIEQIDTWLDGVHVAKDNPDHVAEAQHYCDVIDDDLIQCALYDRAGKKGHLIGVEYVLSENAFEQLPPNEREYWHPHNYEVLSGMLVAPGVPKGQENALMKRMLNTYGKTWHTWPMGEPGAETARIPVGEPELAWSFNADNEAPAAMLEAREKRLNVNMRELRQERQDLVPLANPQQGVNALADDFPNRKPIKGVREIYPTDRQRRGTD